MDRQLWNRWWRRDGLAGMRAIAFREWDPYGVDGIAPPDEYDSVLLPVAKLLLEGAPIETIASRLRSEDRERDLRTAHALSVWYRDHGPDQPPTE